MHCGAICTIKKNLKPRQRQTLLTSIRLLPTGNYMTHTNTLSGLQEEFIRILEDGFKIEGAEAIVGRIVALIFLSPAPLTQEQIAEKARKYVETNIKYVSEDKEQWQFYFETQKLKHGDCDDGAILMHAIMLKSGIPYWRIRINAGNVQDGGHAYLTYLREKDNQWYVMDWCYYPTTCKDYGLPWKKAEKYYSDTDGKEGFSVWFSFNQKYMYGDLPKEE